MRHLFATLLLAASLFSAQAQKTSIKIADAKSFLRDILAAKYSKADKRWTLPNTPLVRDTFGVEANGGLFVSVDTIILRDVGPVKEAWVLFTVEGYMFNFARLEKSDAGWKVKTMRYRFHEGAPGEYAPESFGFQMVGRKTLISVREIWYASGVTTTRWLLFNPLRQAAPAGEFDLAREGQKEQDPEAYTEMTTLETRYEAMKESLPDILLAQRTEQKTKGKPAKTTERTLRYRWNLSTEAYQKVAK
jgi:hypothetical protein